MNVFSCTLMFFLTSFHLLTGLQCRINDSTVTDRKSSLDDLSPPEPVC